ncbi:hypothetical protein [Streptoalloteichus hindustanus]|uniref:Uncharacterized protein n=1 Tax=Streptoalloteichus hindustanus TaxID=2017 RepID=A0A1M5MRT2_STRHI|nr:hypothetical protein [Streptoalloteichus hindustanus]SHG80140.1 hypothetical protein SAMN05444320_11429 [Streptoalloteichus hindustanus]
MKIKSLLAAPLLVGVVLAASALPASAAETETTTEQPAPVVLEDVDKGSVDLTEDGHGGKAPMGAAARRLPYLCKASVDYPHNSHTTTRTINVHFDTKCGRTAPNLSTEGSLYRSRWYGWEHLTTKSGNKSNSRNLRVVAPKGCKPGTKYRYRGQARFYVSGPEGRGSAHVYNQNDSEITCRG